MIQQPFSLAALRWPRVLAALMMGALSACRPNSHQQEKVPAAVAPPAGESAPYTIDAARSLLTLRVYKEGPMAALGHNHVIAVHDLHGSVQWRGEPTQSGFALEFPAATMTIDEPELRAAAGADFSAVVADSARAGTRRNMLGERLLDADRYPDIQVQSERVTATAQGVMVQARVTVHGRDSRVEFPATVSQEGETLSAHGEFDLLQSSLGLTPFSVALGALRVADRTEVQFDLVATRAGR